MKRKTVLVWALLVSLALGAAMSAALAAEQETILVAAAASLENAMTQSLIPMFEEANPGIHVDGAYDSSGKLQTQIEEGLEADLFLSAAVKQMNALKEEGLVDEDTVKPLLENKIVLIATVGLDLDITSFADIVKAETIALGDPESVPAGQYAKEALESLGVYEEAAAKASLGTNVTEVLNWVAEGSAQVGIVYATDAAQMPDKVQVLCEAPEGSLAQPVLYPLGIVTASAHKEAAQAFADFLQTEEAWAVWEASGFSRPE